MDILNEQIVSIKQQQVAEVKGDREQKASDLVQEIIEKDQEHMRVVRANLQAMNECIDKGKEEFQDEPEVRVMIACHSTLMDKFKETLRTFQQEQTNYKQAVQGKI